MKNVFIVLLLLVGFDSLFAQVRNPLDDNRKIKIPIVFHVLYKVGNENIHDSLIRNELTDLNRDFSASNDMTLLDSDFRNDVGNPNIEFVLLDTSIKGVVIKGVQRVSSRDLKNRDALLIDPANCVNVFVADHGDASDILSDRVNLHYESVGTHSHVLTHETGHWLGLYHIFGQIGTNSFLRRIFGNHDDLIGDTPSQRKASAVCYAITQNCPCPPENIYFKGHKTMYNNFMDYNPCRCMFSVGQATQMRNNVIEHKSGLFRTD